MGRDDEVRDLFDDHYDQVVRTAFLIVQDWGRAEEIAQDAFVQLLRHWRRVAGTTSRMRGCGGSRSGWR